MSASAEPVATGDRPAMPTATRPASEVPRPILRPRMPELDSVRGLAVLAILAFHALYFNPPTGATPHGLGPLFRVLRAGWLGVPLFFVLSGFLITGILLDTRDRTDFFRRFYGRRARRIFPAYLATLLVLWVSGIGSVAFIVAALLFLANVSPLLGVERALDPLWSLAVEEQFYLVWPLLVRRLRPAAIARVCVAILAVGPFLRWRAFEAGQALEIYYYTWYTLDGLAAGALLALALRHPRASCATVTRAAATLAGVSAASVALALALGAFTTRGIADTVWDATLRPTAFAILFAAALALVLVVGSGARGRLVQHPVLAFLGYISYGLYLVQGLVVLAYDDLVHPGPGAGATFLLVRFAVVVLLSIGIATVSRRTLEAWFLGRRSSTHAGCAPAPTG